jgi:hypothetical protein
MLQTEEATAWDGGRGLAPELTGTRWVGSSVGSKVR